MSCPGHINLDFLSCYIHKYFYLLQDILTWFNGGFSPENYDVSCPHWNVAKTGGHTPQLSLQFCAHAQTRTFCRSTTRLDYGRRHFLYISWWSRNSSIGVLPMHDLFLAGLGIAIFWWIIFLSFFTKDSKQIYLFTLRHSRNWNLECKNVADSPAG